MWLLMPLLAVATIGSIIVVASANDDARTPPASSASYLSAASSDGIRPSTSPSGGTRPTLDAMGHGGCGHIPDEDLFAEADLVVEGAFAEGPGAPRLYSPAAFEVERYLKGEGPELILVRTARRVDPETGVSSMGSGMVDPLPGERWHIKGDYLAGTDEIDTSRCAGSHPLDYID